MSKGGEEQKIHGRSQTTRNRNDEKKEPELQETDGYLRLMTTIGSMLGSEYI